MTTKIELIKAIYKMCLGCVGVLRAKVNEHELIDLCKDVECPLWLYRNLAEYSHQCN